MNLGELDVNEVNLILEALGEMPAKRSLQLLSKLIVKVNGPQAAAVPNGPRGPLDQSPPPVAMPPAPQTA